MPEIENFETVVLQVFDDPVSAQMAQGWLEAEQIPCHLDDLHISTLHPGLAAAAGNIKLVVSERDAERALSVLERASMDVGFFIDDEEAALFEGPSDMGPRPTTTDLTCPECFSLDIALAGGIYLLGAAIFFSFFIMMALLATRHSLSFPAMILFFLCLFTGSFRTFTNSFRLRCTQCGYVGKRKEFYLMSDD